jgi:hypothetical protein
MTEKTLDVTSSKDHPRDVRVFGNTDAWQLICKAHSSSEKWMRSTKAMEIPGIGCLVQVSTQQGDHVAEAVCFVPFVSITTDEKGTRSITPSKLVKDMFEALVERLQNSLRDGGPGPSATVHED